MYHPGKVIEVLSHTDKSIKSADETTQAIVEMWDENHFTFLVDNKLSKDIKSGDIVLVDYRPMSEKSPLPYHKIIKILDEKIGKRTWSTYKEFHNKRKKLEKQQESHSGYLG